MPPFISSQGWNAMHQGADPRRTNCRIINEIVENVTHFETMQVYVWVIQNRIRTGQDMPRHSYMLFVDDQASPKLDGALEGVRLASFLALVAKEIALP